ncbi:hypothetical protein Q7P36_008880 [Cladosporium allicinum]
MRLMLASAAWLFAVLATAVNSSECTTFISTQAGCCPPASSSTVYSAVDCHGCSLATTTTGIHCMMICPTNPATSPGTTTLTTCSQSPTCTSTITTTEPFGCTVTVPPKTKLRHTDCHGCALETATVAGKFGVGPSHINLEAIRNSETVSHMKPYHTRGCFISKAALGCIQPSPLSLNSVWHEEQRNLQVRLTASQPSTNNDDLKPFVAQRHHKPVSTHWRSRPSVCLANAPEAFVIALLGLEQRCSGLLPTHSPPLEEIRNENPGKDGWTKFDAATQA